MRPERIALILIAAVALVGFVVSPALGGPGFLTKKKASKLFLKKSDAKRLFLAKADAEGRFLTKLDAESRFAPRGEAYSRSEADSRFLRPEGEIRITSGPASWVQGPTTEGLDPVLDYFADAARLQSGTEATAFVQVTPEIPAVLYGRTMKVTGAELCYDASTNAQIQLFSADVITESEGIGAPPPITNVAIDGTPRTDNTCRAYKAASPVPLGPGDYVVLGAMVDFPTKSLSSIMLGRVSVILQP